MNLRWGPDWVLIHTLAAAIARGGPIVPVFVLDDPDAGEGAPGGASRWWLHGSLRALDDSLRQRGAALVLRRGPAEIVINQLLDQTYPSGGGRLAVMGEIAMLHS